MATDWITTDKASEIIGITRKHAALLARRKKLDSEKFGRDWRISRRSAEAYAAKPQKEGRPRSRKPAA